MGRVENAFGKDTDDQALLYKLFLSVHNELSAPQQKTTPKNRIIKSPSLCGITSQSEGLFNMELFVVPA